MIVILPAQTPADLDEARRLFREHAEGVGVDFCFRGFEKELDGLPGTYAPPQGRLLLALASGHALDDRTAAGCVALRPLSNEICEMKRLYVCPQFRGTGLGRRLAAAIITEAIRIGYDRMRLDTLPSMETAISLYRSLGFRPIKPYYANPAEGALYMEADLGVRIQAALSESKEESRRQVRLNIR